MRRPFPLLALAFVVVAVAACAAAAPGWTYAPPTVAPPSQAAPSGGASAGPSGATESAAPSGSTASAAPSPAASGASGGTVQISAMNTAFEQAEVTAPANVAFVIHFNNKDAGAPHNVAIKDSSGMEMFRGDIITGPKEVDYQVRALPAGTYQFVCSVHANMVGKLTVGG